VVDGFNAIHGSGHVMVIAKISSYCRCFSVLRERATVLLLSGDEPHTMPNADKGRNNILTRSSTSPSD
jgi:hypothetical protein